MGPQMELYQMMVCGLYTLPYHRDEDRCIGKYLDNVLYMVAVNGHIHPERKIQIMNILKDFAHDLVVSYGSPERFLY